MPLYRAEPAAVQSGAATADQPAAVACRCCPGGISRSLCWPCYPSDMSGAEWALCEPLLPHPAWLAGQAAALSGYCMRDIADGIRYPDRTTVRRGGRCLPTSRPPGPFTTGPPNGRPTDPPRPCMTSSATVFAQVAGRKAAPTAAIIDSQSVRAAEEVARSSRGYDAGKKINGRKRHIAVDVTGLLG